MRQDLPRGRILAAAVLAAGALAAGIAGVAAAADGSGTPTPTTTASPSPDEQEPQDRRDGPWRRFGHHHGPDNLWSLGGALHGEYVAQKPGGGYQTVRTQWGEVTAVSTTSITLKSEDGFTASYTVTPDTLVNAGRDGIATVKTGETATVVAVKDGDKVTARRIVDLSRLESLRERFLPWREDKDRDPRDRDGGSTSPAPAPSGSARSSGFSTTTGI